MLTDVAGHHNGVDNLAANKDTNGVDNTSVKAVTLVKDENGFGLTICGGTDYPHIPGDFGIFVSDVSKHRDLPLNVGDRILAANGHSLINVTHDDAIRVLKGAGQSVLLDIESNSDYKAFRRTAQSSPFKKNYEDGIILSQTEIIEDPTAELDFGTRQEAPPPPVVVSETVGELNSSLSQDIQTDSGATLVEKKQSPVPVFGIIAVVVLGVALVSIVLRKKT